ncbi:MAG: NUDIX hydrolase [Candidatus Paceibacterota bacterium]
MSLHTIALVALLNAKKQILLALKDGQWWLLGGHREKEDRGRHRTVTREVWEESKLEEIFDQQLLFSCHEWQKSGALYVFDISIGHYFGDKPPTPLVREGIVELRWFDLDEAEKLKLTPLARKTLAHLRKTLRLSFLGDCLHHLHQVIELSQARGASEKDMADLKRCLNASKKALNRINKL